MMDPLMLQQILELLAGSGLISEVSPDQMQGLLSQAGQVTPAGEGSGTGSMSDRLSGNPFKDMIAGWKKKGGGFVPGQWADPEKIRQHLLDSDQSSDAMMGLYGWDAFNPNAISLSEAQDRVIRQRGDAMRQAGLNRAKIEGMGDPYMTQYANMRNMFDTGDEISRVQNDMMAQRQQSLEDFYRNFQNMRVQHAMNVHEMRVGGALQPKQGKGLQIGLPNWMGGGSIGASW